MTDHLGYLRYVVRHKRRVYRFGRELRVPRRRLLLHDWSKFTRDEWLVYARKFYGDGEVSGPDWRRALLHHYRRNDHHPEHWILFGEPQPMPPVCVSEMLADWRAMNDDWAGVLTFFETRGQDKPLHPETRELVETILKAKAAGERE